jgi:hypothetical protein
MEDGKHARAIPEDLDNLKGVMLAVVGVSAELVYDATGWKRAGRLADRIEERFEQSGQQ